MDESSTQGYQIKKLKKKKPYIELITKHQMNATNYLGKDEFKIMNNSVYGKTYQNFRKQEDINLVKKKKKVIELVPNDLLIKEMKKKKKKKKRKTEVQMDILMFIGEVILSISKTLTYQFHSK